MGGPEDPLAEPTPSVSQSIDATSSRSRYRVFKMYSFSSPRCSALHLLLAITMLGGCGDPAGSGDDASVATDSSADADDAGDVDDAGFSGPDGGLSSTDGAMDAATDAGSADAATDAGSPMMDAGPEGPLRLPEIVPDELNGDYELPPGETARVPPHSGGASPTLDGNLTIRAGATLEMRYAFRITGLLVVEAGATLVMEDGGAGFSGYLFRAGSLRVEGTRASPVIFDGVREGFNLESGATDITYGDFREVRVDVGQGDRVRIVDSRFVGSGVRGAGVLFAVYGDGQATSLVDYNDVRHMDVYLRGVTFSHGELWHGQVVFGLLEGWSDIVCGGTRDGVQDSIFVNNVFAEYDEREDMLGVDREYGAIDITGNYFQDPIPRPTYYWLNASNDGGTPTAGCGGTGDFGGPVTWIPTLSTRPETGPR